MSLNFAIKDLLHHKGELKGYLKISITFNTLLLVFMNFLNSLGLLILPQHVTTYSYTILEFSTQYNSFLLFLTLILAIFINSINNHTIITSRKKDISIMKAVGSVPRQLYSFYLTEVLLLTLISFLISFFFGFILNYLLFIVFSPLFATAVWNFNTLYSILFGAFLLISTFVFNGWEIRKIGTQSFEKTQTGLIKGNLNARIKERWKKVLNLFGRNFTLAFKNLKRKQALFKENIVLISLSSMILLSGFIGSIILLQTSKEYIGQAQGEKIIAIAANPILESVKQGYEAFQDSSSIEISDYDYIALENNLTNFKTSFQILANEYDIANWESRLLVVETIFEQVGYDIVQIDTNDSAQAYITYGEGIYNRTVPIQGINYGYTVQNWYYGGAMIDISSGVALGDTIAGELFENAYQQRVSMIPPGTNQEFYYHVNAIVVDSFNNGNSVYMSLVEMQDALGLSNYTNLIMVDYGSISTPEELKEFTTELNTLLSTELGQDFGCIDLSPIFQKNIQSLNRTFGIPFIISLFIGIFIIYLMYEYQKMRSIEDRRDFQIIRALGGLKRDLLRPIWYQNIITISLGVLIGLIGALYFLVLFLMEDATLPSIYMPLGIFFGILSLFIGLSWWSAKLLTNKYFIHPFNE